MKGERQADQRADRGQPHALTHDKLLDIGKLCAQGHAQSDLTGAPGDESVAGEERPGLDTALGVVGSEGELEVGGDHAGRVAAARARTLLERSEATGQPDVDNAWEEEIERRIKNIDAGLAKSRPFAEVVAEIDRQLGR